MSLPAVGPWLAIRIWPATASTFPRTMSPLVERVPRVQTALPPARTSRDLDVWSMTAAPASRLARLAVASLAVKVAAPVVRFAARKMARPACTVNGFPPVLTSFRKTTSLFAWRAAPPARAAGSMV
jgi:hypothetical protein